MSLCTELSNIDEHAFICCNGIKDIKISPENQHFGLATNVGKAKVLVKKDSHGQALLSDLNGPVGHLACGNLEIPSSMTSISRSFWGCSSLTSVSIPASIVSIDNSAFLFCFSISKISVDNANEKFGLAENLKMNGGSVVVKKTPDGCNWSNENNCVGHLACGDIVIPEGTTELNSKFINCVGKINKISLPASLTSIDSSAFSYVAGCKKISISDKNSTYGLAENVGKNCYGIVKKINNKCEWSASNDFVGELVCGHLVIPETITVLPEYFLMGNFSITGITIPSTLLKIEDFVLRDAKYLSEIIFDKFNSSPGFVVYRTVYSFYEIHWNGVIKCTNSKVSSEEMLDYMKSNFENQFQYWTHK